MQITITARHTILPDDIKEHTRSKLENMFKDYPRVETAHVIFDTEKFMHLTEIVVQGKNKLRLEAEDQSDDIFKSSDAAIEKIERQLRRSRDKIIDHKASRNRETLKDVEPSED